MREDKKKEFKFFILNEAIFEAFQSFFMLVLFLGLLGFFFTDASAITLGWEFLSFSVLILILILFSFSGTFGKVTRYYRKEPYLIVSLEGIFYGRKKPIKWPEVNTIQISGVSGKKFVKNRSEVGLVVYLNKFTDHLARDLTGKNLHKKEKVIMHIERKQFESREVFKALRSCAPKHVKFFTPIGY